MSRRTARKNAFSLLFQMSFANEDEFEEIKKIFFSELEENIDEKDYKFINFIVDGVKENIKQIDEFISKVLIGWSINRISKVDLAILRIAIYEMKFIKEASANIVINEAVEIAKEYGSDGSPSFVNGILGKLV